MADTANSSGFLPPRWIIRNAWRAHRALYRLSGGKLGLRTAADDKEGYAQLVTVGRKSGVEREVMIAYFTDGDDYVTMAMNGWSPEEPQWWLNLQTNPRGKLTVPEGAIEIEARAATAGEEHDRLWNKWRELDKFVDKNSGRRTNGTRVVIFTPVLRLG